MSLAHACAQSVGLDCARGFQSVGSVLANQAITSSSVAFPLRFGWDWIFFSTWSSASTTASVSQKLCRLLPLLLPDFLPEDFAPDLLSPLALLLEFFSSARIMLKPLPPWSGKLFPPLLGLTKLPAELK